MMTSVPDIVHMIAVKYVGVPMCTLVILAGVVGCVFGSVHVYTVRTSYIRTSAQIDTIHSYPSGRQTMYKPSAAYVNREGNQHRLYLPFSSNNRSRWTIGTPITFAYPADNPSKANLLSPKWDLFQIGGPLGMSIGGGALLWVTLMFRKNMTTATPGRGVGNSACVPKRPA